MAEAEVSSEEESVDVRPVKYKEVAKAMDEMRQNIDMFKELLNVENCNQSPTMLKDCEKVHFGTKIEIHYEKPKASFIEKIDKEKDEMFDMCSDKMKQKYETHFSYMRSFLWESKKDDFSLKDFFVELTVRKTNLFGNRIGEKISLNEIFAIAQDRHQTILVTGDPGYGKSTLCKKIAYDWASENYLQHFDLTLLLVLRELNDKTVKDALLDNVHELTDKNWKLQDKKLNVLVILDGFDEMVDKSKIIKFIRDESFDISRNMTILVTSRPQAAEDIREDMKMRIVIKGFSPEYQEKYIQLIFEDDESKANELISALTKNDFFRKISECPLMLHMSCCLHRDGKMEKLETMADLYIRIFTLITERYVRKTNQEGKFKRGKYFVGENLLLKLTRLNKDIIGVTSKDLMACFRKEDEYNFITGLDILTLGSFYECDNIICYRFVHQTFGEFLSAFSIYIGYISFPYYTRDMELLFLMGLYKDEPLSKKFLTYVNKEMFTPQFMLRAHRQIKLKRNWQQFCSHSKVIFRYWKLLIKFPELFDLYEFKELYLYFLEANKEQEGRKDYEHYFSKYKGFMQNFKIYLILSLRGEFSNNLYDIREPVSRIIDFLQVMKVINVDIHFIGVKYLVGDYFNKFTNVKYNLYLSDIRKLFNISEDEKLVTLKTIDSFKHSKSCILSLEQYETLRDYILL
ncbi:uncharacterized protein LOC111613997 [Centruroides sculpturatus]|uniref:uncharacterized protein LOC111613997 n=1 Tax=Centruroides sculpturatus TaxID=218467 RepID=UPI000C6DEA2E|nr:uncharacterized protein LOC111613997 [Centruroides sculpturatus]XP_023211133.1 uncharacterized protein LOC111613997 [Centruroides sculpturatus]